MKAEFLCSLAIGVIVVDLPSSIIRLQALGDTKKNIKTFGACRVQKRPRFGFKNLRI